MEELDPAAYTIVWIAPLLVEAQAALHMLDNRHPGKFPVSRGDDYVYSAGDINGHNIVVATLPAGQPYGTGSAGSLAGQVKKFFPNLWFGLLVGVAAGLPNLDKTPPVDIRLGDVLVGLPEGESAGLIAYDLGKETADGFQPLRFGHVLANTEAVVRSAIGNIRMMAPNETNAFIPFYDLIKDKEHSNGTFADPGQEKDTLYHTNDKGTDKPVKRSKRQPSKRTRVWYGPIGSGEKLTKNARKRDELRDRYGVIGLEMEAAGTMNTIPVGVIRGACDYADEHKNKEWQPYAAAMAAAYAKAVIYELGPGKAAPRQGGIKEALRGAFWREIPPNTDRFFGRENELSEMRECLENTSERRGVVLCGISGSGKTQLAREYVSRRQHEFSVILWIDASSEESIEQSMSAMARIICDKTAEPRRQRDSRLPHEHVLDWLRTTSDGNWLVVIDNANDAMPNRRLLGPFKSMVNGSLCVTSTNRVTATALGLKQIVVERLDIQASQSLLLWRAYESEEDQTIEVCNQARHIATLLDGFPLALELAGSLNRHGITSLYDFSEHYTKDYPDLTQSRIDSGIWTWTRTGVVDSLFGMLDALYESLVANNKDSALLLTLCSVYGPLPVPISLIHEPEFYKTDTPSDEEGTLEQLQNLTHNKIKLNKSVDDLSRVFLATKKLSADRSLVGFSLHASICQWRIFTMKQPDFWIIQAAYSLSKHIESVTAMDARYRFFRMFSRCLDAIRKYIDPPDLEPPHGKFAAPYFAICLCGGDIYLLMGKAETARKLFTAALTYMRTLSDEDSRDEDLLRCLDGFAMTCEKTRDLKTAEEALVSATEIAKRTHGKTGAEATNLSHRLQKVRRNMALEQKSLNRAVVAGTGTKKIRVDQQPSTNIEIPIPNDRSSSYCPFFTMGIILEEPAIFLTEPDQGKSTEPSTNDPGIVRGLATILSNGDVELDSIIIRVETTGRSYKTVLYHDSWVLGPFNAQAGFASSNGATCTHYYDGEQYNHEGSLQGDRCAQSTVLLPPGSHSYLFEFVLDARAPETTETKDIVVTWVVRATFQEPEREQELQKALQVVRIPSQLSNRLTSAKQVSKRWEGELFLNVELFDVCVIGRKAPITVNLTLLDPNIEIVCVSFSLVQQQQILIYSPVSKPIVYEHVLLERNRNMETNNSRAAKIYTAEQTLPFIPHNESVFLTVAPTMPECWETRHMPPESILSPTCKMPYVERSHFIKIGIRGYRRDPSGGTQTSWEVAESIPVTLLHCLAFRRSLIPYVLTGEENSGINKHINCGCPNEEDCSKAGFEETKRGDPMDLATYTYKFTIGSAGWSKKEARDKGLEIYRAWEKPFPPLKDAMKNRFTLLPVEALLRLWDKHLGKLEDKD